MRSKLKKMLTFAKNNLQGYMGKDDSKLLTKEIKEVREIELNKNHVDKEKFSDEFVSNLNKMKDIKSGNTLENAEDALRSFKDMNFDYPVSKGNISR